MSEFALGTERLNPLGGDMDKQGLYTITEAMKLLGGISRNTIYDLMREGRLASLKIGKRRFVPSHAIDEFIDVSTTTDSPSLSSKSKRMAQMPLRLVPVRGSRNR